MLERYYKYKIDYKEYILIFKVGSFYIMFDKDALIMNYLFKYKLINIRDTYKCGFPISSINKIKNILNLRSINYVVISNTLYISKFENNNYSKYNFDIDNLKNNYIRIDKIIKYLNDNINNDISDIIDKIEKIINTNLLR
ncbi:MAG: hypothetical protein IJ134_01025 [Bacilli bacterium]|nr:hypothetical protein [Bacilli bacterium]